MKYFKSKEIEYEEYDVGADSEKASEMVKKSGKRSVPVINIDDTIIIGFNKGAIVSFTRSLALSLVSKEIRVNGVAPGPIWTPLIPSSFSSYNVSTFGADTPMKRAGQPVELGPLYLYLASEDSTYVTGQIIHVNGGSFTTS